VLAVGDEAFQRKCLRRISEQIAAGATLVLVSHDAGSIERACERVVVLDAGRVEFDGPTAEGLLHYHRLMGTEHGSGETLRRAAPGPLQVTEVELRDSSGRVSTVFRRGETLEVIAAVQLRDGPGERNLALELRDQTGAVVLTSETPVTSESLAFAISDLSLAPGSYDVSLGPAGGQLQRTVRFTVDGEPIRGRWRALERVRR
jgi:ABC-type multidrug transport system ATPase subunit